MRFSILDYIFLSGTVVVEAGLSLFIQYAAYPFLRLLSIFFGVMAVLDFVFFFIWRQPSFAYIQWYSIMALLVLQAFVAAELISLVCPRMNRTMKRILPAVIVAASIINGKPGTTWGNEYPSHHMLVYEIFCLAFLILAICVGYILSSVPRYETVLLGFGFLLAAQSVAALHRLYVGISPFVWNACWLAGIAFIVHAIFTYEPLDTFPLGKSSRAGRTSP